MASKSIFRAPGAKHFAVVHRSMRDPLIHDEEAGDRVLSEMVRGNDERRKGKATTREELDNDPALRSLPERRNIGEAAMYDVFFDDTEYDYMQHLRPTGQPEAIFVEAPSRQRKTDSRAPPVVLNRIEVDLPADTLPTPASHSLSYKDHLELVLATNSAHIGGSLNPDMDLSVREVLEALDDEDYVQADANDQFFGGLIATGGRDPSQSQPTWAESDDFNEDNSGWERNVAAFKSAPRPGEGSDMAGSLDGYESDEGLDQLGELPRPSMPRHSRQAATSAFSMSSSSVFRNNGLSTLDDRFDQVEREYDEDEKEDEEQPEKADGREDFDAILDEFLHQDRPIAEEQGMVTPQDSHGLTGSQLRSFVPSVKTRWGGDGNATSPDRNRKSAVVEYDQLELADPSTRPWDCQTILSTYSNVSNHPRVLRAKDLLQPKRGSKSVHRRIAQDPGGFPIELSKAGTSPPSEGDAYSDDTAETGSTTAVVAVSLGTLCRDRDEKKEEKRARKACVKAERAARRQEKKAYKNMFSEERRKQLHRNERQASSRADVAGTAAGVIPLS